MVFSDAVKSAFTILTRLTFSKYSMATPIPMGIGDRESSAAPVESKVNDLRRRRSPSRVKIDILDHDREHPRGSAVSTQCGGVLRICR